jgi:hypothetical protein
MPPENNPTNFLDLAGLLGGVTAGTLGGSKLLDLLTDPESKTTPFSSRKGAFLGRKKPAGKSPLGGAGKIAPLLALLLLAGMNRNAA